LILAVETQGESHSGFSPWQVVVVYSESEIDAAGVCEHGKWFAGSMADRVFAPVVLSGA